MSDLKNKLNKLKDTLKDDTTTKPPKNEVAKAKRKVSKGDGKQLFALNYVYSGYNASIAIQKSNLDAGLSKDESYLQKCTNKGYLLLKDDEVKEYVKQYQEQLYKSLDFTIKDIILQYTQIIQLAQIEGNLKEWRECLKEISKLLGFDKQQIDITSGGMPIINFIANQDQEVNTIIEDLNLELDSDLDDEK